MVASDYLRDAKVVVVGAGAIGGVLAYRLAQAGAEVAVVERRFPAAGTTGATFAYVNGTDKPPREYHRLSLMGIRDHEALADELGGDWLHVTGSLHWAEQADTGRASELARVMRRLLEWGARVDRLTPDQAVRDLEPDLRIDPGSVETVYLVDRAGWLDPVALTWGALRAAAQRYGARLVVGEVRELRQVGDVVPTVVLADGTELMADVVINAAGPDARAVATMAGSDLPLERTPGLLVVSTPVPNGLGRVVYGPDVHLRPDGGSRIMVQWEPLDTHAIESAPLALDDRLVAEAMGRAADVLPALRHAAPEGIRLGVRPMPRDGFPLVGFDPAVANLYHVVTHSGITLAARLARLVTEELTGGDTAPLDPYRPGRTMSGSVAGAAD